MGYKNYGCKVAAAKRMQSCLDQLRAEGIDIGEELEFCESEQESAPLQITCGTATVCDLPPLDAAFSVLVRIIARQSITVDDCQITSRSEEHTSELQSHSDLVCRLLLEKKKKKLNT